MTHVVHCRSAIGAELKLLDGKTKRAVSLVRVLHYQIVDVPEEPVVLKRAGPIPIINRWLD